MSVTVNYKNNAIATIADGGTKTLLTSGTWLEDDIEIVDTTSGGGGGAGAISVTEDSDSHGGTVVTITGVDISNDTVTVAHLESGYTAHDAQGNAITGTLVPTVASNDFVITISKNANDVYVPDCTFTELQAAYSANKNIIITSSGVLFQVSGTYDPSEQCLYYNVTYYDYDDSAFYSMSYIFNNSGVSDDGEYSYYYTEDANAVPSDVLNGAVFYNANGKQIGAYDPPTLVSKSISSNGTYNPSSDSADGYSSVTVNVPTGTARSSSDLTVSGATVTVPAGLYSTAASKSVAAGSVTAPSSASGTGATINTGSGTITLNKTISVTPNVTTAGYISSGTAGNMNVTLTANVTTKAAATITPGTTDQTIAGGTYLAGTQTIKGDANLVSSNILAGKSIFGVSGSVAFQTIYSGSSNPSSSTGVNGDIYVKVVS